MLRLPQVFWQKVAPHRGTRDRSPQSPGLGVLVTNLSGDDAPPLSFPNTKQMRGIPALPAVWFWFCSFESWFKSKSDSS